MRNENANGDRARCLKQGDGVHPSRRSRPLKMISIIDDFHTNNVYAEGGMHHNTNIIGFGSTVGSLLLSAFQGASDERFVIDTDGLHGLIRSLRDTGHQVIGPRVKDDAIILEPINSVADLPAGWSDEQNGGHYRIERGDQPALFGHGPGPQAWKRYLYPPVERMFKARRNGAGFTVEAATEETPKYAFLGVRACDLHAMDIQETVFDNGLNADPRYVARKSASFIVAVNCSRAGGTCFCASMGTGPRVEKGFDLSLTEVIGRGSLRICRGRRLDAWWGSA